MSTEIEIFPSPDELAVAAAEKWIALANGQTQNNQMFHVALSGGSTPKRLFHLLAENSYANRMNWERVHVYFGDERFVPSDHADSNFRMANEALLSLVAIPSENIHRVPTELPDAASAASAYEKELRAHLPKTGNTVCFDLIFLGLGTDGHTASLFPDTSALTETRKLVTDVHVKKLDSMRITLTYPVINQARNVIFLVEGESKKEIVREILGSPGQQKKYPAQGIQPSGQLCWMLDRAAASGLETA